ncbi:MAG: aspartate carbamoyltransferase [Bacillota bacterium]
MLGGKDILTTEQLTREELEEILRVTERFDEALSRRQALGHMEGLIMAALFFEPSTRTRLSFESAMQRLGGSVINVADAKTSSAAKGETLSDAISVIQSYCDVIVIRHPDIGSAEEAARASEVPVINGGDGSGQHPTQALLDMYTIKKEKGRMEGLTVSLVGDLKHGRTVHSLVYLLALYGNSVKLVSPESLAMPGYIRETLAARGADIEEVEDLGAVAGVSDVIYVTRVQKERFQDLAEYERVKGAYVVNADLAGRSKEGVTIMHPLPRVDEIAVDTDGYSGAAYFRQAANGVPTRMALLAMVTGRA